MSRAWWGRIRLSGGVAILAVVVWRLGTGPFLDGVRGVDASALGAAVAITMVTTTAAAWRWCLVARGLGVELALRPAVAAYYGSQLLNSTLPGGVLGDVHRGVSHGRDAGDVSRGLRAVAWERVAGQVVQAFLAVLVLLVFPSPVHAAMPFVAAGLVAALSTAVIVVRMRRPSTGGQGRGARLTRTVRTDIRDGLLARSVWPGVLVSSLVVVTGHTATFLIAARTAGSSASTDRLLPLAMLVLLAMSLPLSIGGWGPREGVAAWSFGAAGLGASLGVATATAFGIMGLAACLPGLVVLAAPHIHGRRRSHPAESAAGRELAGASHG